MTGTTDRVARRLQGRSLTTPPVLRDEAATKSALTDASGRYACSTSTDGVSEICALATLVPVAQRALAGPLHFSLATSFTPIFTACNHEPTPIIGRARFHRENKMKGRSRVSALLLGISATSALRLPTTITSLPRASYAASERHDIAIAVLAASAIISSHAAPACAWDGPPTSALLAVVCDDRGRCTQPAGAVVQKQVGANLQSAAQSAQSAAAKVKLEADNGARVSQARAAKMQADVAREAKKAIPKDVQNAAAKATRDVEKSVSKVQKDVTKEAKKVIPKDVQKAAAKVQKDAKKGVKKAEKEVKKAEKEAKKAANKLQRELGL